MSGASAPTAAPAETYKIRCAEIWGGSAVKQDQIETPGARAAIHSSASGDAQGGDFYYFSVCAYDTLTRIAVADVRGHGAAVSHLSEWLYEALERRMNDPDGAAVLTDLNGIVRDRFRDPFLDLRRFIFDEMVGGNAVPFFFEQLLNELAARIALGRAGVAAGNDHAPDTSGCMVFVFVGGRAAHPGDP